MKHFVFRNHTIESFFASEDYIFSGYDDISHIPDYVDDYIWFYQIPIKAKNQKINEELELFVQKLMMAFKSIPQTKNFIAFTLFDSFHLNFRGDDFSVIQSVSGFNIELYKLAEEHPNVKVINTGEFFSKYGVDQIIDWKYYFISQMPFNPKLANSFKGWFQHILDEINLKRKKCLIIDLDNTIWGGILGEDGSEGIRIGGNYPGNAFLNFQESIIELTSNGVILAVCSKNNEQDVVEVWESNPFNLIKIEHVSSYRINWNDKASNISEISKELNIGLDSIVFFDDNPTERELIRQLLPQVVVPDFPDKPYELLLFFKNVVHSYFRVYSLTHEDIAKTSLYKANSIRRLEQKKYSDMSEYLKSLEINIIISEVDKYNISRIAQMTQKTNQFNLTTRRYTESEIHHFIEKGWVLYCLSVSDKFGDSGLTGTIIIEPQGKYARIDTLLLSCRILGKEIEKDFLNTVVNLLKKGGYELVLAEYIPTSKNLQVIDFYESMGFDLLVNEDKKEYQLDLKNYIDLNNSLINIFVK